MDSLHKANVIVLLYLHIFSVGLYIIESYCSSSEKCLQKGLLGVFYNVLFLVTNYILNASEEAKKCPILHCAGISSP